MHTPHSLQDSVAVVVGASGGLGTAVTELLVAERARVFALSRTIASADLPPSVERIPINLREPADIDRAFGEVDAHTDCIDILVNCAGRGLVKPFQDLTREEIMEVLGTNLKGNVYAALEAYRRMLPRKSGHIVNVASTTGVKPKANETIYAASKAGLRAFGEALRMEAAPHGIRVTTVSPGGMDTGFWQVNGMPPAGNAFMDPADVAQQIVSLLKTPPTISPSELIIERGVV
jgi:NAD(P)-dependent dehydrogenase (short-subunit alcohol dehydrogenase family)